MDLSSILNGTTKKGGCGSSSSSHETITNENSQSKKVNENDYSTSNENQPSKSGDPSGVVVFEPTFEYEEGSSKVSFSCSRIDNDSADTTGTLFVCAWISASRRENNEWQDDKHALIGDFQLGTLEEGYVFPDVNCDFEIPQDLLDLVSDLDEWHFVFTINELNEDGNYYIVYTINTPNQGIMVVPVMDENISACQEQDEAILVYYNDEVYSGILESSNGRARYSIRDGRLSAMMLYHDNNQNAVFVSFDNSGEVDAEVFMDTSGNEVTEDEFKTEYDGFYDDESITNAIEELYSKGIIVDSEDENNDEEYDSYSDSNNNTSIAARVCSIIADKLNVDESEVVPRASFTNDLGADSLDSVELIMEFEKTFGVSIPDDQAERITTVGDAIAYIESKV